jgi:hypothetical protein
MLIGATVLAIGYGILWIRRRRWA